MTPTEHAFFEFFEPSIAAEIAATMEPIELAAGDILFKEGDAPDYLYLVLEGTVEVLIKDPVGEDQPIASIHANDFLGELAILDGGLRSATVAADGPAKLAAIPRDVVLKHLRHANTGFELTMKIIGRIRESNRTRVEERLHRERMTLVGKMINGIIHDFRNPLAVISMLSELIKIEHPDATEHCESIREQIERMTGLTEAVLEFSRGVKGLSLEPFSVMELLTWFERVNRDQLATLKINLQTVPCEGRPRGDRQQLFRVLQNLVANASEAMKETGGIIRIEAQYDPADGLRLHVADNGPGIPDVLRQNLFEVFATHGKRKGIALGLAQSRSIVMAHGGTIRFETKTGKGTVFHIHLPPQPES